MAIFLNSDSKVIVQGMTGSEGRKHTHRMLTSGTQIVGGVTPGKGGQVVEFERGSVPVFNSVGEAMAATDANVTVIFVPAKFTLSAVVEAIEAGIPLAVVITEGVPVKDTAEFFALSQSSSTRLIGPNCPGLISPGQSNAGIIPADITKAGRIGLVSKSGTLTYQMMYELRDFGFSSAVGIGGDPIIGTTHIDALQAFEADPDTDAMVMICSGDYPNLERARVMAEDLFGGHLVSPLAPSRDSTMAPRRRTDKGNRRHGDDRRDWRRRGGAGSGLHYCPCHQTGGRLRRRLHRARRQDHGARRRNRVRLIWDRCRQERGVGGCWGQGRQDAQRDRVFDAPDHDESLSACYRPPHGA